MAAGSLRCVVLISLLGFGVAGCQRTPAGQGEVVQIGSTQADFFGMPAPFRALHPKLEKAFGRPVLFSAQPSGAAIGQQLAQGGIALAFMTAGEYAAVEDSEKLTLLATGINAQGRTSRKAFLVVKAGSHVKTVTDCAGKRFAFGTHRDLLTDFAARAALEQAGVPVKKLLLEILPPPVAFDGRLYLKADTARTIANDLTVNAGVIDEVAYEQMPSSGGNLITGPSKDQFSIVGETLAVPELVAVAGPAADPQVVEKFKEVLLEQVKDDKMISEQLGVKGFAEADRAAYDAVRTLLPKP